MGWHSNAPKLPGITAPRVAEVGHVALSGNQWGTASMFDGVQDGAYAGQGNVWTAFDRRKSLVRQAYEGKASLQVWHDLALEHIVHVTLDVEYAILSSIAGTSTKAAQWSLAARPCLFKMGPRYGHGAHSVNHLVCVDIRMLWHPVFSVDGLHRPHSCLKRTRQFCGGVVSGDSPLRGCFQVVPVS